MSFYGFRLEGDLLQIRSIVLPMSVKSASNWMKGAIGITLILLPVLSVPVAAAASPAMAAGGFSDSTTVTTSFRIVNGVLFITLHNTGAFSGDLSGPYVEDISIEVSLTTGIAPFRLTGTCTCTLNGHSGTFNYKVLGVSEPDGSFVGQQSSSTGGTGGLSGLTLSGTVAGTTDRVTGLTTGTYEYQYHFNP